jgi:hypothetical protein
MKKKFDRKNSWRCVEYWTHRGYTEDEARGEIRKKCSEFSKLQTGNKRSEETRKKLSRSIKRFHTLEHQISLHGEINGRIEYDRIKVNNKKHSAMAALSRSPENYRLTSKRCVEYWLNIGYSEEESKLMVSKHNSRGINFYISKYGVKEGTEKFIARNKKWQKNLSCTGKTKWNQTQKITTKNKRKYSKDEWNIGKT